MAEKRKIWRVKDEAGTLEQVLVETSAEQVKIADAGSKITATNVEDALQELATEIANAGEVDDVQAVNGASIVVDKVARLNKTAVGLGNVTNDAQVKRSEMGVASGVATLDTTGKVPTSQLPSYVDDVLEYANKAGFPATGEAGKIYVDKDTNLTYRWSGSAYVEISPSLALGETSSTAYAGDKGKANADEIAKIKDGTTKVTNATNADYATDAGNAVQADVALEVEHNLKFGTFNTDTEEQTQKETWNGNKTLMVGFDEKFFDAYADTVNTDCFYVSQKAVAGLSGGTYTAVYVDTYGRVKSGGKAIEWGASGQKTPSNNLMVGGIFFELQ